MKKLIIIVWFLMFSTMLTGAILEVPDGYTSLEEAVTQAEPGDTVLVNPGEYQTNLILEDKDLVIASRYILSGDKNDIDNTILKSLSTFQPIILYKLNITPSSRLVGFTMDAELQALYGLLRISEGASPVLEYLRLKNHGYSQVTGAAILIEEASAEIRYSRIENNHHHGIFLTNSHMTMSHCSVSNNQYIGVMLYQSSADITYTDILGNISGGVDAYTATMNISDSRIMNNTRVTGAGFQGSYADVKLERVLIAGNIANGPSTGYGGGIYVGSASNVKIINCTIADNQANQWGGGIFSLVSNIDIINSIIWGNNANGVPEIGSWSNSKIRIAYSNVRGGPATQSTVYGGVITWLDNIMGSSIVDHNPSFDTDYRLTANSPCIDEGAAVYSMGDELIVNMPQGSWAGAAPDMGVYEYEGAVPALFADFTVLTTPHGPAPLSVRFSDISTAENTTITSWEWDFGNGGGSSLQAPLYTYETPGSYTVTLTVSDGEISDSHTIENMIIVLMPEIQADFSYSPGSGPIPLTVRFTDKSTGPIDNRLWKFGDEETSTQIHPEHIYTDTGTFDVTLIVYNAFTADTLIMPGAITAYEPIKFQSFYVANDGSDVTGDGSENNPFATIQHGINMASDFDTVIVKDGIYYPDDDDGFDFIVNGKEIVLRSENGPENCILQPAPDKWLNSIKVSHTKESTIISGFTIRRGWAGVYVPSASPVIENCIIDSCSYGIITSRDWQFDGDPPASSPIIRYNLIKNSTQEGIAMGEGGTPLIINNTVVNSVYTGISVMVYGEVINNISVNNGTGISSLEDNQANVQYNCIWGNETDYFQIVPGEGDVNLDPLFTEDYRLQAGSPAIDAGYPVYPPDPDGTRIDMGAFYYHQDIQDWTVDFTADVTSGRAPLLVNFTDLSTGNPATWNWNFGDQAISLEQNPTHTYETPGTYTVTLEVSDGSETRFTEKTAFITVNEPLHQNPVAGPFEQLTSLPGNDGDNYLDGAFITKNVAFIVTNKNRLYKTIDGGETWTDISPESGTDFSGLGASPRVHFINENIGTVAFSLDDGSNEYNYDVVFGYVWCTTDGGATWSQRFDVNDDMVTHLQQVNETTVYVSGTARFGVTSTRWFKKITRDPATETYILSNITPTPTSRPHVYSGHWLNQNTGVVMARLNVSPWTMEPFITRDGGQTWTSIKGNLPVLDHTTVSYSNRTVQMLNENSIIIIYSEPREDGYITRIRRTDDGGVSWFDASFDITPQVLTNVRIDPESGTGFAAGYYGKKALYITNDSGASWEQYTPDNVADNLIFYGVDIAFDGTAWAFGPNQTLWRSRTNPSPDFIADITDGPVPLEVHFSDLTAPGTSPVTDVFWDFGDGTTSEEQNPVHTYTTAGIYTVTLSVTDSTGTYTMIKEDYITANISSSAMILSVTDVPEDQGGWGFVAFSRSFYDTRPAEPTGKSMADTLGLYTVEIRHEGEWISANSTAAYAQDTYEILVHTLSDSSVHGDGMHDFRIISAFPDGRFISPVVQGYSVDNIAPGVPEGLGAEWLSENQLQLSWVPSDASDFAYFILWKSLDSDFNPEETNPVVQLTDTLFVDTDVQPGTHYFYRLAAVDYNGNVSGASPALDAHTTGIKNKAGIPDVFDLSANFPNPFNPRTTIPYQIPEDCKVDIRIFDLSGRHVQTLVNTYQTAGYYDIIWNGTDFRGTEAATGVYIIRMQAGKFVQTMKILYLK